MQTGYLDPCMFLLGQLLNVFGRHFLCSQMQDRHPLAAQTTSTPTIRQFKLKQRREFAASRIRISVASEVCSREDPASKSLPAIEFVFKMASVLACLSSLIRRYPASSCLLDLRLKVPPCFVSAFFPILTPVSCLLSCSPSPSFSQRTERLCS